MEVKIETDSNDSMEIKTEADSNDITAFQHDARPSVGMFGSFSVCIPLIHVSLSRPMLVKDIIFYCCPLFYTRYVISQLTK